MSKIKIMEAKTEINPGVCNFNAVITAKTEDGQNVTFKFTSECETIKELEKQIKEISPVDAIASLGPEENTILSKARKLLQNKGCCEACIVPASAVKVMQVVTHLALPKDVSIKIDGCS